MRAMKTRTRFCVLCGDPSWDKWRSRYPGTPYEHWRWYSPWALCEDCRVHHQCDVLGMLRWCFGDTGTVYEEYPGGGGCCRSVEVPAR